MTEEINVYDERIPVATLAERLALSDEEILSLASCAPNRFNGSNVPPPDNQRASRIRTRLYALRLVLSLVYRDAAFDETVFTWVRTQPGERLMEFYRSNGFDAAAVQARLREAGE